MKKLLTILLAVLLVFTFVSFAAAQEDDFLAKIQRPADGAEFVPTGLPWAMFMPHYDVTPGAWWTGLVVQNMSFGANQCTIWIFDDKGYQTGYIEDSFMGLEKMGVMLTKTATAANTGFLIIESQLPMTAFVNFGQLCGAGCAVTTLGPFISFLW